MENPELLSLLTYVFMTLLIVPAKIGLKKVVLFLKICFLPKTGILPSSWSNGGAEGTGGKSSIRVPSCWSNGGAEGTAGKLSEITP